MSALITGSQGSRTEFLFHEGQILAGYAIGVLVLDLSYPAVPGNVQNATTFSFPLLYNILKGVTFRRLAAADPTLLEVIIKGARELEKQGVRAIVGACGYFANYQEQVAKELHVPVFLSSLLQIPTIECSLRPHQKVGVVCGDKGALTADLLKQCGVSQLSDLVIAGAENSLEFQNLFHRHGHFSHVRIQQEMVELARKVVRSDTNIGAVLLECSDMPPYAKGIQDAIRLPVFDYITLINWVHGGVVKDNFGGGMQE